MTTSQTSSPKISIITPTGARPESFELCLQWVKRQTKPADEWIIIDDGEDKLDLSNLEIPGTDIVVVHPEKVWRLGDNTQKRNMLIGLDCSKGDVLAVIEDDDWYAPNYIEAMYAELMNPRYHLEAVGELNSRYYNIRYRKWCILNNSSFSPLCQTMFRRTLVPVLKQVLAEGDTRFDIRFWRKLTCPRYLFPETKLTVGMKAMPGRPGLGIGHNPDTPSWRQDNAELDHLRKWIGDDAEAYMDLV